MNGVDIDLEVIDRSFQQALRQLAVATNKPYSTIIKQNARLVGVNLAFQTQPFGADAGAKEMGEAAVRKDLKKVFADAPATYAILRTQDEDMAKAFYKAMLQKDWVKAEQILRSSSTRWRNVELSPFNETLHRRSRNNRGRVSRHVPAQIVTAGYRKLDSYTNKKVRMVGFGKAGWATAILRMGGNTRGIPQFVTRHKGEAPGSAQDNSMAVLNPHVVLANDVKYIDTICSSQQVAAALSIQRDKMLTSIERVTQAAADRFNRS